MDPTELLNQLRAGAKDVLATIELPNDGFQDISATNDGWTIEAAEDLARKFLELDHWLSYGGFLPQQWRKKP